MTTFCLFQSSVFEKFRTKDIKMLKDAMTHLGRGHAPRLPSALLMYSVYGCYV